MEIVGDNLKVVEVGRSDGSVRPSIRPGNYESKITFCGLPNSPVNHKNTKEERNSVEPFPRAASSPLTNFKLPSENRHNMLISQQYEKPPEREKVLANIESKEIQDKPKLGITKINPILKEGECNSNEIETEKMPRVEEKVEVKTKCLDNNSHKRDKPLTTQAKHKRGCGKMGIPHAVFQLMNDIINVVSFKCSISNNINLVSELEAHQQQGWQVEIEKRKRKVIEQRNAARKRIKMTEMKRNERLKRLTNHTRHHRQSCRTTSARAKQHQGDKETPHSYMKDYIEKVTKHIGIKKEAAVWKHVPQPGQMPKPPSSNAYRGKKKSQKANMRSSKNSSVVRGGKKRRKKTSKLDKFTAKALSPRSLIPKRPNEETSESKDSRNGCSIDPQENLTRVSHSVNVALVRSETNAHVAATRLHDPTQSNTPKRPQTAKASFNDQDKCTTYTVEDSTFRLSPRLRLLHHSNVKRVVKSQDLFSLDDEDWGRQVEVSKTKQMNTQKVIRRPRTASFSSSRSHRNTRKFRDQKGANNKTDRSIINRCLDHIVSTNEDTQLRLGTLQMSPVQVDETIECRIRNSEQYALKALNLLSEAANSMTEHSAQVQSSSVAAKSETVSQEVDDNLSQNKPGDDANYSAGSGANVVMARRKQKKNRPLSRNRSCKTKVIHAGLPGWSGPAGSSLKKNSTYAAQAESFSFAMPNLQLQLVSHSRSHRPWELYAQANSPSHTSRRGTRTARFKSSSKHKSHAPREKTALERWQNETEVIIKRLNQIRIQQGNTLRSEHESKKGKEIIREKRRWKELMQREHKREMKILKRELKTAR